MFEQDGEERVIAAARSRHPLGKCFATPSLRAYLITSKYADGMPLYHQEQVLKRLTHEVTRTDAGHSFKTLTCFVTSTCQVNLNIQCGDLALQSA